MVAVKRSESDTPMASKKFIAYLIAELTWKIIIILLIFFHEKFTDHLIMLTIVIIAGFIEVAYILGQTYIDKYMKIADAAFEKAKDVIEETTTTQTDPKGQK